MERGATESIDADCKRDVETLDDGPPDLGNVSSATLADQDSSTQAGAAGLLESTSNTGVVDSEIASCTDAKEDLESSTNTACDNDNQEETSRTKKRRSYERGT